MKLLKMIFSYFFFLSFFALADNGLLEQQLKNLQEQLAVLERDLQEIVPTTPEVPLGLTPEMIDALKHVDPKALKEILDYYQKHGQFPPTIPELPKRPDGPPGPPPPPPPPPPPGTETIIKLKGLTRSQLDGLTEAQKKDSDQYLIKLLQRVGFSQFASVNQLQSSLIKALTVLGQKGAQSQGFLFVENNEPDLLVAQVTKFIKNQLSLGEGQSLDDFLASLLEKVENGSIQQDLIDIFAQWVLDSKDNFKDAVADNIEKIIVNFGAAVRSDKEPQEPAIALNSPEANNSDEQFVGAFVEAVSKEDTIRRINLLRIDPVYLKYMSLQQDVAKAPARELKASESPTETKAAPEATFLKEMQARIKRRAQLTPEEIEARLKAARAERPAGVPKREEIKPLTDEGIISILQRPKGQIKPSQVTSDYLRRYMFEPVKFQPVRDAQILIRYLGGVVITRVEPKPIIDYFHEVVAQAESYNDVLAFMRALSGIEISGNMRLTWKQIKKKTDKPFDSTSLRALKTQLSGLAPRQFTERIAQLIDEQSNSVNLTVPVDLFDKLRGLQAKITSALRADTPEQTKKELNNYLENNVPVFYDSKLKKLSIDEAALALAQAIREAQLERR